MIRNKRVMLTSIMVLAAAVSGCSPERSQTEKKSPRPVTVFRLTKFIPSSSERIAGTVVSWKTDEIGFEVSGPVQFVIEQEKNIDGNVYDKLGKKLLQGTLLARLDSSRYELKVKSMEANIEAVTKQKKAAEIELAKVLPAKEKSVEAQRDLAKLDIKRYEKLLKDGAAGQRELDVVRSSYETAIADLAGLQAQQETKKAEIESLVAQIKELEQQLNEAKRNVKDCELYAPFQGQIAAVHVIPGSFVRPGQAVVTLQMMEIIKVAFEVSAETAGKLNHRDMVAVYVPMPGGALAQRHGAIWTIGAVADPATRTITIDVLLFNEKTHTPIDATLQASAARTSEIGAVVTEQKVKPDALFVNNEFIGKDKNGVEFLWKITNRSIGRADNTSEVFKVRKIPIKTGDLTIKFLGAYVYREFEVIGEEVLSAKKDLVAGKLDFSDTKDWDGETVIIAKDRWLFRPGDLVSVDLNNSDATEGFYVPLDAIAEQSGKKFIFEATNGKAKKTSITIVGESGTFRKIKADGEAPLKTNMRIIRAGAHYLVAGAAITVTEEIEVKR